MKPGHSYIETILQATEVDTTDSTDISYLEHKLEVMTMLSDIYEETNGNKSSEDRRNAN